MQFRPWHHRIVATVMATPSPHHRTTAATTAPLDHRVHQLLRDAGMSGGSGTSATQRDDLTLGPLRQRVERGGG